MANVTEMNKVIGSIVITHEITCPCCSETMYDDLDREWWNQNVTDQLPSQEGYEAEYEINCKECNKPFIVDGFQY